MSKEDPIILVDGSSYLYRAYHALPPLENSKKQPQAKTLHKSCCLSKNVVFLKMRQQENVFTP